MLMGSLAKRMTIPVARPVASKSATATAILFSDAGQARVTIRSSLKRAPTGRPVSAAERPQRAKRVAGHARLHVRRLLAVDTARYRAAGRKIRASATSGRRSRRRHLPAPADAWRADARCRRSAETASDRNGCGSEPAEVSTISRCQAGSTLAGPQRPFAPVCELWMALPKRSPLSADTRKISTDAPATGRLVGTPPGVPVTSPLSLTSA